MEALINGFFNLHILREAAPYLLRGLGMTLLLCVVAIPLGIAGGLMLALMSTVRSRLRLLALAPTSRWVVPDRWDALAKLSTAATSRTS